MAVSRVRSASRNRFMLWLPDKHALRGDIPSRQLVGRALDTSEYDAAYCVHGPICGFFMSVLMTLHYTNPVQDRIRSSRAVVRAVGSSLYNLFGSMLSLTGSYVDVMQ